MRRSVLTTATLAIACVLAGCPGKTVTAPPVATTTTTPTTAPAVASGAVITGTLTVPAGIVASGAGNIVASGAGNIVAAGAGNIVAAGAGNLRSVLAIKTETAGGAKVYLADAAGNPIPNLPAVQTDASGKFTIPNVPPGFTFMVAAEARSKDGKTVTFQTLTKSSELGATADISPSTALVTATVVRDLKNGDLGSFNPSAFRTAAETTERNLADDKLPDFSNRADVLAKMDALVAAVSELKASLDQVKQDLADIKQSISDLQKAIEQQKSATPPPTTTNPNNPPPTFNPNPNNPPPTQGPPGNFTPPPTQPPPGGFTPPPTQPPPGNTGNPPPGACNTPTTHYFYIKTQNGTAPQPGWHLSAFDPNGGAIADVPVDANGYARATLPAGCQLRLVLADAAGGQAGLPFAIDPSRTDSTSQPIILTFALGGSTTNPQPTPTTGTSGGNTGTPTNCAAATSVRIVAKSNRGTGLSYIKFRVPNSGALVYEGPVAADGSATVNVPLGCPHDVEAFDTGGSSVGQVPGFIIRDTTQQVLINFP